MLVLSLDKQRPCRIYKDAIFFSYYYYFFNTKIKILYEFLRLRPCALLSTTKKPAVEAVEYEDWRVWSSAQ